MKRIVLTLAVLMIYCVASLAQATAPQGSTQTPPAGESAPAQAAPPAPPAAPAGTKSLPQAKTQEEYQAFSAAASNPDLTAAEAAASEFVTKFPESELRGLLYRQLMQNFQQANNADKMIEMARKAIQYTPDDPVPLVMAATVLGEKTRKTDLDRDERLAEATKYAQQGLQAVETSMMVPVNTPPEQIEAEKMMIRSLAHAALGTIELNRDNNAAAEKHLLEAVQINAARPDALTWLRLALAQDNQKKYKEALESATKAESLADASSPVKSLAAQEKQRLVKLTTTPAPAAKPATPTPPKQ